MRKKGYVYRFTTVIGFAVIGMQLFGGALWGKYQNDTPEEQGAGDGVMSPQMAEIDALLKVKDKRRAWKDAKEAKLQ